jgi:hypothetical protein
MSYKKYYRDSNEVIALACKPDGILWKAGQRDDDILLDKKMIGQYCTRWNSSRGQRVTFRVVSGGNGPRLEDREIRTITFMMPKN